MSSFIPETAPFNDEQRAWLNGFFSALAGLDQKSSSAAVASASGATALAEPPSGESGGDAEVEESFPWHDASLPIVERMEMAEGKPTERKLMAAMAQLDCGSCGYVCQTYAEAIASGEEPNLTLCSPGGKETKQMLKQVLREESTDRDADSAKANGHVTPDVSVIRNGSRNGSGAREGSASPTAYSRQNPFDATLVESRRLNGEGSSKDTRHVVVDLAGSGLKYEVGDSLGVFPRNGAHLVDQILSRLATDPHVTVTTPRGRRVPLDLALREDCCLKEPSDELIELLASRVTEHDAREALQRMVAEGAPDGFDVLDLFDMGREATVTATEVMEALEPLNPRLYSIASSMKKVGDQVHLTVGKVSYPHAGRIRKGVASTMLADGLTPGERFPVFVQPNHGGFTVPADPAAPMIMVGPGTGIAPFLAFLQERAATAATGKHWLFFGDQHESCDFLYRDELQGFLRSGQLSRLDTAFSRDHERKVYVQDRMREHASEIWQWLQQGAHFFICGDASRMAVDVDRTLTELVAQQGSMSHDAAKEYIQAMAKDQRYVRDVY